MVDMGGADVVVVAEAVILLETPEESEVTDS